MKKILCLAVILLLVGACAFADTYSAIEIALYGMSTDELIYARSVIDKILEERSAEDASIIPRWFTYGMGQNAPDPNVLFGRNVSYEDHVFGNKENILQATLDDCTKDEYKKYVDTIIAYGFTDEFEHSDTWYEAKNSDGISARIVFLSDEINVQICDW